MGSAHILSNGLVGSSTNECPGPPYHQRQLQLSVRDTQKPNPSVGEVVDYENDAASWEGLKKKTGKIRMSKTPLKMNVGIQKNEGELKMNFLFKQVDVQVPG